MTKEKLNTPPIPIFRELMDSNNVKRDDIAKELGVSSVAIGQYYNGDTLPSIENLIKIARYFDVSTDYLLGLTPISSSIAGVRDVCEFTGLSEGAILSITEYWKDIPEEWQESKDVLSAFMESTSLFYVLSYVFDYKEEYLRKCDLEKQAEQVLKNACELSKKQIDEDCNEIIIPKKEEQWFLRDSGYYDILEKCDVYLYRAQREFSKFTEKYAKKECKEWQTSKNEETKTEI